MSSDNYNVSEDRGDDSLGNINKKYTFFVIDGSPAMFENGNDGDFRSAARLVLNELLNVCCLRTLNNQIGILVTNTRNSSVNNLDNCIVLVPIGIPDQDAVNEIKGLIDDEDIEKAFQKYSGGHQTADLAQVFNYCKREFSSFSNTRHQSVVYLTNDRNPFASDEFENSDYFRRTRTSVLKIVGHGQRKTLGEFSVILLPTNSNTTENEQSEPWFQLDPDVFSTDIDVDRRIRQKTTCVRSHANISIYLAPNISFDIGVFTLASEAIPLPHTKKFLKETEQPIQKKIGYVAADDEYERKANFSINMNDIVKDEINEGYGDKVGDMYQNDERGARSKRELKRMVELGGIKVVMAQQEFDNMGRFAEKGITLIGFRPIDSIDTELCVAAPKFVRPNEETTMGSTRLYRALLDRCHERQQTMICRYQSRSNEKLRLVALIPWKKEAPTNQQVDGKSNTDSARAQADASEFLNEGFHVFFLPYKEEIRDDSGRFKSGGPTDGSWPEVTRDEVDVSTRFVRRLVMSYNPGYYENPRLLSQKAALCERATGDSVIERNDTLAPYHTYPPRLQRVRQELSQLVNTFSLEPNTEDGTSPTKRKVKSDVAEDKAITTKKPKKEAGKKGDVKELHDKGKLMSLTRAELDEAVKTYIGEETKTTKATKQQMVDMLTNHFDAM